MNDKQKDLEKLFELKKLQDEKERNNESLSFKEKQELFKLAMKYANFSKLSIEQMEEELKKSSYLKEVEVNSKNLDPIIDDYKNLYSKEGWYKEPETKDGKTSLTFPSQEEAGNFFKDQAENNRAFIIVDGATNKVLAYSNGDGKLYNGNRSVYTGGEFQASEKVLNNFEMPEMKVPRTGKQL